MKFLKRFLSALAVVAVLVALAFILWAENTHRPADIALQALGSDERVIVTQSKGVITFQPVNIQPSTAFVFYPGGRVDYRAYAAPLHKIAAQGYLAILVPVRLNLAFFDVNAADRAIAAFPDIQYWAVGGHSLGGVASALYVSKHDDMAGLILWASYPPDDSLKNSTREVISIYGTLDMGGMEAFDNSRALLPVNTQYIVIEGGNHAQFGDYGFQPGDNEATITRADQQQQSVDATVRFLESLSQ
ncbi:MAG: alpha/beta hydrolase [Anaerolineales bacterium]